MRNASYLQAGLWSGELVLRDLEVRTDVSRKLHLPIVLKQGSVDLVRIQARGVYTYAEGFYCCSGGRCGALSLKPLYGSWRCAPPRAVILYVSHSPPGVRTPIGNTAVRGLTAVYMGQFNSSSSTATIFYVHVSDIFYV